MSDITRSVDLSDSETHTSSDSFSVPASLGEGVYTIVSTLTGTPGDAGLSTLANSSAVLFAIDGTAPVVSITSLSDNETIFALDSESSFIISGAASDDSTVFPTEQGSGVALVQARMDGGDWGDATGADTWSIDLGTLGTLTQGSHTVEVRAFDVMGNESTIGSLDFMIDTEAPIVTLDSIDQPYRPARSNDGTADGWIVPLSGSATDTSSISYLTMQLSSDERSGEKQDATFATDETIWNIAYPLTAINPTGTYTIETVAEDELGNLGTTSHGFLELDTTAPVASLTV